MALPSSSLGRAHGRCRCPPIGISEPFRARDRARGSNMATSPWSAYSLSVASRRRALPDGDVFGALAREWLPVPDAPPLAQLHAGELRHQVELRWPDVAEGW